MMKNKLRILLVTGFVALSVALLAAVLFFSRQGGKRAAPTARKAGAASSGASGLEVKKRVADPMKKAEAGKDYHPPDSSRETGSALGTSREGYRVVGRDEDGITVVIDIPACRVDNIEKEGKPYQEVSIPGYLSWADPGRPSSPAKIIKIPLPGVGSVRVKADLPEPENLGELELYTPPPEGWSPEEVEALLEDPILENPALLAKLPPREKEFLKIKKEIRDLKRREEKKTGPAVSDGGRSEVPPGEVVEAGEPYWQRDEQFVNLLIKPVRYLSSGETLVYLPRISVELKYGPPAEASTGRGRMDYGEQFKLAGSGSFKASVAADGLHEITYQNLVDAGFPVAGDPRDLRMFFLGNEISIYVHGEDDGSWNPGDYIHFFGQANTGFYSQTNAYWLYQDTTPGLRMDEVSAPPCGRPARQEYFLDSFHLEKNYVYYYYKPPGAGDDYWFWTWAGYSGATTWTMETSFVLSDVSQADKTVAFTGCFVGNTSIASVDPDHHTRVRLNGNLIGDFYWDGKVEYVLQTDIPQNYFIEGSNTITVDEVKDTGAPYDYVYVNYFDLSYYRGFSSGGEELPFSASKKGDYTVSGFTGGDLVLYEATDPDHPVKMTGSIEPEGSEYLLRFRKSETGERDYIAQVRGTIISPPLAEDQPSDLTTPRLLDYILVTHPDFSAAVGPLITFRQGQGLLVESFLIQDVYDTFSYGNFDPAAIRNFLQYTYYYWTQPPPSYVLLVGDGNYDYQDYKGWGYPMYIPPYLIPTAYMQTASDNWYACIVGDDKVPDMNIGRLAVNSFSEATGAVQKIIDYENQSSGLPWQAKILMVADTADPAAGDFPADSNWLIANYVPAPYVADTAYRPNFLSASATRAAILAKINEGRLIVNYLGHGTNNSWGLSTFFAASDINSLNNASYLPLMTTMTCLNGYWCDPLFPCLAEVMVNTARKGTIANFSPSGLCLNSVSRNLAAYLFDEVLVDGQKEVGPAVTEAKSRLGGLAAFEELDLYHLFGDPALTLK